MNSSFLIRVKNRVPWQVAAPGLLLVAFVALRLPALGRYVTVDEALWLRNSAQFYYAVTHGDWAGTYLSAHPGLTTLWAGFLGFLARFPELAQAGDAAISDFGLRHLLLNRGVNPVEVLAAGRAAVLFFCAAAFLASWPYARRLLGPRAALLGMLLLAFDPFMVAHGRFLHQDGLLTGFMLLALLALLDYLQRDHQPSLAVAGLATGLAGLTKTPGWFLVPVMLALLAWRAWQQGFGPSVLRKLLLALVILALTALAAWALLFPAMWVQPGAVLSGVLDYTLASAEGGYSGPVFFNGSIYPNGDLGTDSWLFYPLSFLWRSTPLTLFGLVLAVLLGRRQRETLPADQRRALSGLLVFALAFGVLMSLGIKKFDRYLLPAHAALLLLAGWGWTRAAAWWQARPFRSAQLAGVGLTLVLGLQLLSSVATAPYYLSYYNPLLGGSARAPQIMMVGWGEGLDQAARFLNAQPSIEEARVASWYSSSFNLLFGHDAEHIPITPALPEDELEALLGMDYLVVYIHEWQRGTPANLLARLEQEEPLLRVRIDGLEYARVYKGGLQ